MTEYKEYFKVSSSVESLVSSPENDGVNCVRIYLAWLLFQGRRPWLYGMDETFHATGLHLKEELTDYPNSKVYKSRSEVSHISRALSEVNNQFSNGNFDDVRLETWTEIRRNNPKSDQLFRFITTYLFSRSERESFVAATALLKCLIFIEHALPYQLSKIAGEFFGSSFVLRPSEFTPTLLDSFESRNASEDLRAVHDFGLFWNNYSRSAWLINSRDVYEGNGLTIVQMLVYKRLRWALRSTDPFVKEILANLQRGKTSKRIYKSRQPQNGTRIDYSQMGDCYSTIVHGTFAYPEKWWLPSGDFFEFAKQKFCLDLYDGGKEFSWSGRYSFLDRVTAGKRFRRWADQKGNSDYLNMVIAHSYGADIVARAICDGTRIKDLYLLSAPATHHVNRALDQVSRVVDIRLFMDFALCAADEVQRLPQRKNITSFVLLEWPWSHSITHSPQFWDKNKFLDRIPKS